MSEKRNSESGISIDGIVIERIFDAPIALIWKMWTQAEHFKKWYGPKGVSVPVAEIDARVGGKRRVCMEMQTPDGSRKMWTAGEHRVVVPNQRLVYSESPADEKGNLVSPVAIGMPEGYPATTEVSVEMADLDGRTKMVLRHAGMPAGSGADSGWQQAFDKLADSIKTASME